MSMTEKWEDAPLFSGLSREQVDSFMEMGREITLSKGQIAFNEGDAARGLHILLEGELIISKRMAGMQRTLAQIRPGEFVGEISLLTGNPHSATACAGRDSRILLLDTDIFQESLQASPVTRLILGTMAERLRDTEAHIQQYEKLSALGKLAAGLAHEMNNPAAASLRAVRQLPDALLRLQSLIFKLTELNLNNTVLTFLSEYQETILARAARPPALDPLARSDREEALEAWIDTQGIPDSWRLAPAFVEADVSVGELLALLDYLDGENLGHALAWLEGMITVVGLLRTIQQSTSRIYDLVSTVKAYTYMDRSPEQSVNVHEGLENTLIIMEYKLKDIVVTRDYAPNLPPIRARGSQLNQVWTNLLDNAADALDGQGHIGIRTWRDDDYVVVEIADDGPGIPPEIRAHIFEPFFTTKEIGRGSGLGLDIVHHIVVQGHRGDIRLRSQPGDTRFQVYLPINEQNEQEE